MRWSAVSAAVAGEMASDEEGVIVVVVKMVEMGGVVGSAIVQKLASEVTACACTPGVKIMKRMKVGGVLQAASMLSASVRRTKRSSCGYSRRRAADLFL